MSILNKLTEGIVNRDLRQEGDALLQKWEKTGLLEGIESNNARSSMSRLLENQAKELLREASSMAAGDVEGFAAVAFPIVRRVFGGLIANDLVSVQPMSLPSGLIFFMDFTYESSRLGTDAADSIYGGGVVGQQLTGGVSDITERGGGFYDLANAYSSPSGSAKFAADASANAFSAITVGTYCSVGTGFTAFNGAEKAISALTQQQKSALQYDPDLLAGGPNSLTTDNVVEMVVSISAASASIMNFDNVGVFNLTTLPNSAVLLRRLTHLGTKGTDGKTVSNKPSNSGAGTAGAITFYTVVATGVAATDQDATTPLTLTYPLRDNIGQREGVPGAVVGKNAWGLEEPAPQTGNAGVSLSDAASKNTIAEIDIKVDSVAVTAITKKLKAKWSPELGQDLNAYHNLDAEVELTSVLSEHIALEIDREILNDLVKGAKAGTYYWSRAPGL
jgi:hypothetical protein